MHAVRPSKGQGRAVKFLKGGWLFLLLLFFGACALITVVIIAYPILAHIAAKFFP